MSLRCRRVQIEERRAELESVLNANLSEIGGKDGFRWEYLDNPLGPAVVWVLEDETGAIAGVSSAFPRRVSTPDGERNAWVLGDFCVEKKHRVLGPAVALQREACEAVGDEAVDLWYDFPSRSMLAVYARLKIGVAGELSRLVLPLRIDDMLAQRNVSGAIGRVARIAGSFALAARDWMRWRDPAVEISLFTQEFEEEPDRGYGMNEGVHVTRTAEYLNWRYRCGPGEDPSVLRATRDGSGCGFIVFRELESRVSILDVFGVPDEHALSQLVLEVLARGRSVRAASVTVGISDRHPWRKIFEKLGFHRRGGEPFTVLARPGLLDESVPWFLLEGDRDP